MYSAELSLDGTCGDMRVTGAISCPTHGRRNFAIHAPHEGICGPTAMSAPGDARTRADGALGVNGDAKTQGGATYLGDVPGSPSLIKVSVGEADACNSQFKWCICNLRELGCCSAEDAFGDCGSETSSKSGGPVGAAAKAPSLHMHGGDFQH